MNNVLSIVIPVYNEGANFPALWEELQTSIRAPFVAYVVYDFDEDNTVPVVQAAIAGGETRLRLLKNDVRAELWERSTGFRHIPRGPCWSLWLTCPTTFAKSIACWSCTRRATT